MKSRHTIIAAALFTAFASAHAGEIPQSATLQYQGNYGIPATMTFTRKGNDYTIAAQIKVPLYRIHFESGGKIVGTQLHPTYYQDVRNGKTYASAKMAQSRITYGRPEHMQTENVSGRVMDLFTLSWQLAFNDGKLPNALKITNGKKLYQINGIQPSGSQTMTINGTKTPINSFNVRRGDDTVKYAFAPAFNNAPAVIHYFDGNKQYQLTLKSITINGKTVKP